MIDLEGVSTVDDANTGVLLATNISGVRNKDRCLFGGDSTRAFVFHKSSEFNVNDSGTMDNARFNFSTEKGWPSL
jgi:hypothetical protein